MKKPLLLSLAGCLGVVALAHLRADAQATLPPASRAPQPKTASRPADKLFTSPPPTTRALPPVVSAPDLAAYCRTLPARIQAAAKPRNVEFMPDCLAKLTAHLQQFAAEGQRTGLTLPQIQDNNDAFVGKVVADLRNGYDQEEAAEHQHDPKNPLTGKSLREEAEIYHCGLKNYLPLFNNLMASRPVITILTQPTAAQVFMAEPTGYRSVGTSQLTKPLAAGLYTFIFTKPGYQSIRKTFAAQRMPVQVFRTTLPALAAR
ncbi:MAG: hypothetical protein ACRYFK_19470 [Janthinobacterium lividum]